MVQIKINNVTNDAALLQQLQTIIDAFYLVIIDLNMAAPTKEYGLFMRNSNKSSVRPKLAIFDDDSDEDGRSAVGKSLQKEANRIQAKKQVKLNIETALSEDPTVFEYDEIYDDIAQKKQEQTGWQKRNREKTPKYITSLMKAAKTRKLEQERALERKVQKEREAEGEEFAGKEAFVTSAYKKKMQEMEELEEKERQEAHIEALTDVTKQKDLSGFYRHLYKHTLGTEEVKQSDGSVASTPETLQAQTSFVQDDLSVCRAFPKESQKQGKSSKQVKERQPRQFRRHRHSTDSSSENESNSKKLSQQMRRHSSSSDSDIEKRRATSSTSQKKYSSKRFKGNRSRRSSSSSNSSEKNQIGFKHSKRDRRHNSDDSIKNRNTFRRSRSSVHNKDSSLDSSDGSKGRRPQIHRSSKPNESSYSRRHKYDKETHRKIRGSIRDDERVSRNSGKDEKSKHSKKEGLKVKSDHSDEERKNAEKARREKLIALFTKRHVGEVFDQARERYLVRKEARKAMIAAFNQGS